MSLIRAFQVAVTVVAGLGVCAGCTSVSARGTGQGEQRERAATGSVASGVAAPRQVPVPIPLIVSASAIVTAPTVGVGAAKPVVKAHAPNADAPSALRVKRLVVTTGVRDREPLALTDALVSDGSAIYAFAEVGNDGGDTENVRITFERKGGSEKVGDVSLPVPANASRHRTWAFTRFIRAAGVWEAVLWSESGTELGRTSFEVS